METLTALLTFSVGNSPVTGEFPAQRPVTRKFMFSLICVWNNSWVNNGDAGAVRRRLTHYDVTVMWRGYATCRTNVDYTPRLVSKPFSHNHLLTLWHNSTWPTRLCWKDNSCTYLVSYGAGKALTILTKDHNIPSELVQYHGSWRYWLSRTNWFAFSLRWMTAIACTTSVSGNDTCCFVTWWCHFEWVIQNFRN